MMKKLYIFIACLVMAFMTTISAFCASPGLNVLTNDENPLTFDDINALPSFIENAALTKSPFNTDGGNVLLHSHSSTSAYGFMGFRFNPALEPQRPYQISFKIYQLANEGYGKYPSLWIMKNGTSGWQIAKDVGDFVPNNKDGWIEHKQTVSTFASLVDKNGNTDTSDISKILFEWQYDSAEDAGTNQKIYIDDVSVIPAYLITYIDENNNVIRSEYEIITGNSFTPQISPSDREKHIIGWSLENDGVIDETISPNNEDFSLYAVYDDKLHIDLSSTSTLLIKEGEIATISSDLWSRNGTTGITVSYSVTSGQNTISLTDNGNSTATVKSLSEGAAEITCTASTGETEKINIMSKYMQCSNEEIKLLEITKKISQLTEDAQQEEISAAVYSTTGSNHKILWKASNDCVSIITKDDTTATVIAQSNGSADITAYLESDESIFEKFSVTVSGQREKQKVYDLRIFFWGASTTKHPPAESLEWTGNWGMAATAEDKDFVHRLVYYLEERFYPSKVSFEVMSGAEWDLDISDATDSTLDWTSHQTYLNIQDELKRFNPNIIVTAQTGNMKGTTDIDVAFNAYSQLYDMMYSYCPDAIIVAQHCGLSHNTMKEQLVARLDERYSDKVFFDYDVKVSSDPENLAPEWLEKDPPQTGVAAHWGDKGHDLVAQECYKYIEPEVTSKITPSYIYFPESIIIDGDKNITETGKKLTLSVSPTPQNASTNVTWTIDEPRIATISSLGVVTPITNGTVTVTATSIYNEDVYATHTINISNQPETFTVTYSSGTTDTVSGIPSADMYAGLNHTLSTAKPKREHYLFIGWGLTENAKNTITKLDVTKDTTVYAIWKKIEGFEFDGNFSEEVGYTYDMVIQGGFHSRIENGILKTTCTAGEKVTFKTPAIDIENKKVISFSLASAYFDEASTLEFKVITSSETKVYTHPLSNSDFTTYTTDISDLSGNINGIEIFVNSVTPDSSMFDISLDYLTFDAIKEFNKTTDNFSVTDGTTSVLCNSFSGYSAISTNAANDEIITVILDSGYSIEIEKCDTLYIASQQDNANITVIKTIVDAENVYTQTEYSVYTFNNSTPQKDTLFENCLTSYDAASIRVEEPQGIRTKASLTSGFYNNENIEEYGFVVTKESTINSGSIHDLVFDSNYINSKKIVYGVAFNKNNGTHIVYDSNDDMEIFTAVLINIPKTAAALKTELVFRPYIKLQDNRTLYGAKIHKSVYNVALKLNKLDNLDDITKAAVKEILDICGYEQSKTDIFISVENLYK